MKIRNQVTLALSFILISIGTVNTATAQNQTDQESVNQQVEELEKLQRERDIEEFIKQEVEDEIDRSVGEKFERTTGLLDANLSVLNFWLLVAPVLVTIAFIFFRQIILKEWVSHTKKELEAELKIKNDDIRKELEAQLQDKHDDTRMKLQNLLDTKREEIQDVINVMYEDLKMNRDDIEKELTVRLNNHLETTLETTFKNIREQFQEKVDSIEESILEDILSDAQAKKTNLLQQLSNITPSLWKIPDTNQPDIQQKIQQLTKQLEELKAKNPQLFFTIDDYLKQGDALFFEGRYEDAIISYDKVIKKQTDCYLAWASRGWALRRLGRYEEALDSYKEAININPEDNLGWYGRANALRELQRYDEAITAYNKSLQFNPDFEWAWYRKARCYLVKGDIDKALENLGRAIELNPDKLRQITRNDGDWDVIKDSERFKRLIEE